MPASDRFLRVETVMYNVICRGALVAVLVGGGAGCGSSPDEGGGAACVVDLDCAPSFSCVDGRCGAPDSGRPPGPMFDAGPFVARPDSGRPDSALPDTGRPDAGQPDADVIDAPIPDAGTDAGCTNPCAALNAECGDVADSCGAMMTCGLCQGSDRCENYRCVACQPRACNGQCGPIDDRCGGQRDCGGCNSGQECRNNQCVSSCTPISCNNRCGQMNNGCGGTQDCGGCGANHFCNSANYCQCQPRSCPSNYCGSMSDGCGNTLRCGTVVSDLTGVRHPVSASSSSWSNRLSVTATDGSPARATIRGSGSAGCGGPVTLSSGVIQAGGFGFNVPADATISGVQVTLRVRSSYVGSWEVETIQLTTGNTASSNLGDWVITGVPNTSYRNEFRGGSSNTWGRSWTPAEINDRSFTVRLDVKNTVACDGSQSKHLDLDSIRVEVFYSRCNP